MTPLEPWLIRGGSDAPHQGCRRLWSLLDMLKAYAHQYLELGRTIENASIDLVLQDEDEKGNRSLDEEQKKNLKQTLEEISTECAALHLPVAKHVVDRAVGDLPETWREFEVVAATVSSELKTRLFLYVPSGRAIYHESNVKLQQKMLTACPEASKEITRAGNCYAFGEWTACVFHAMRAAELGLRAVAKTLSIQLNQPLETADWQTLIDQIDLKLKVLKQTTRTAQRDEEIQFYSDANIQFHNFKESLRKHVSHARETYEEEQSISVLHRTREFLEVLSTRVKE